uniref:Glutathione peroxidase n=1 Tax=Octopus bimaculoides TaxID=37653 RepID=A0A0L8G4P1_OCTBM
MTTRQNHVHNRGHIHGHLKLHRSTNFLTCYQSDNHSTSLYDYKSYDIHGAEEIPLSVYRDKSYCPSPKQDFASVERLHYKPMSANDIRWNFEKFLINRKGKPVMRFATAVLPNEIRPYIVHLLEEKEEF